MVRVSVEVRSGTARFGVAVRAESVRRAASLVGEGNPGRDAGARSPFDSEGSFVGNRAARAGMGGLGQPDDEKTAA